MKAGVSGVGESSKPGAERVFVEAGGPGERGDPRRVREVARAEPHHVLPRHLIALGRDVHGTPPALAARVEDVGKRDRGELASLDGDERARSAA